MQWLQWRRAGVGDESPIKNFAASTVEERNRTAFQPDLFPETVPTKNRKAITFLIFLVVILVSGALIGSTFAQSVEIGKGLLCDEYEYAERVVTAELPRTEVININNEVGHMVCDIATVAFSVIEEYPVITDSMGNPHYIAKIVVLAVEVHPGVMGAVPPMEVYTTFKTEKSPAINV